MNMHSPFILGFLFYVNAGVAFSFHMPKEFGDPFDILLDAAWNIAERGGVVRADQGEHIRKTLDLHTQESPWAISPFVLQSGSIGTAEIDAVEGA